MSDAVKRATRLLRDRIAEIDEERRRLASSLSALTDTVGHPAPTTPAPPRRSAGRRRRRRIAPRGQRREQLLSHLREHPGDGPTAIATAIDTTPANVHNVLRAARVDKIVRKHGKGYALTAAAGGRQPPTRSG